MGDVRHDWSDSEIATWFDRPFNDLLFDAHTIHRRNFPKNEVQLSTLMSIKTGACPEDCAYCPQSGHYKTDLPKEKLVPLEAVIEQAQAAKAKGATRFCMGAAWKSVPKKHWPDVVAMVDAVKKLGLETCMTLGKLSKEDAKTLKEAGLDYYNHNLDTPPEYYEKIITTRTYQDRLDTLAHVRDANISVCCGGIVGMGESRSDRVRFLQQLAALPVHPQSVPINRLVAVKGTPLADTRPLDDIEFVRTLAVARIVLPTSKLRLSAGREQMSESLQALCFFAGANSIFYGEKLLTTANPTQNADLQLLAKLGLQPSQADAVVA